MTARVLIVDDVPANVKLLEARLTAEYFDVITATGGLEALVICQGGGADIVLLDVMMPGMDGFEVCRRIKSDPRCHHIPVIMVTALDQPSDRVRGLEAGADDFLTKPVGEVALISRVRNLVRLKMLVDELRMRTLTGHEMGIGEDAADIVRDPVRNGRILLVEDHDGPAARILEMLRPDHDVTHIADPQEALFRAAESDFELAIVSLSLRGFDGLRLCSQIRSLERTRHLPLLVMADPHADAQVLRGLDLGVNDYIMRPLDRNELVARARTQIRRCRYTMQLRDNFQNSVELAVKDPLTGLHNRRYMQSHLGVLLKQAMQRDDALSLLIIDIDHFKAINDTHGHDAGDEVLRDFGARLRKNMRGIDLICRFGGEEFVVVMPETPMPVALTVAERLRTRIAGAPFRIRGGQETLEVTISIGVAAAGQDDAPDAVLKRADEALYAAKREGRNRVASHAA